MTTRTEIAQIRTTNFALARTLFDAILGASMDHGYEHLEVEYGLTGMTVFDAEPDAPEPLALPAGEPEVIDLTEDELAQAEQEEWEANHPDVRPEPDDDAPESPQPEDAAPSGRSLTCPGCDLTLSSKRAVGLHIHGDHWPSVRASWARAGIPGIVADWGMSRSTARAWAAELAAAPAKTRRSPAAPPAGEPAPEPSKPVFPEGGPIAKLPVDPDGGRAAAAAAL